MEAVLETWMCGGVKEGEDEGGKKEGRVSLVELRLDSFLDQWSVGIC